MTETLSSTRAGISGDRPSCRKKLIEVALPLEAINAASAREKSIRHGHPSTLHLWWARRPVAACRAVLFAQLVDDPSSLPDEFPTEQAQEQERQRLFGIIQALVPWENSNTKTVLDAVRREIARSVARSAGMPLPETAEEVRRVLAKHAPPVLDPFCGGGSISLEAQRLGLEAHASDLNPVAVLITKALIEIPPKLAGRPPVNPQSRAGMGAENGWTGARGLAEDVRYYGRWMRDEAQKRIGHLYPKVKLPKEHGGGEGTVIAWLWARTVTCPNPACHTRMPLVRLFWLSTKPGKKACVEPVVDHAAKTVRFEVRMGQGAPPDPPKIGRGANFRCLVCGQAATDQHIKDEGTAKAMGSQLMALVAVGQRGRVYLAPTEEHSAAAAQAKPEWTPDQSLADDPRNIWCVPYGLQTFADLFTARQLVAMSTFSDLVGEARERVQRDAAAGGLPDDATPLAESGKGAAAYADAVVTYLTFGVSKATSRNCTLAVWEPGMDRLKGALGLQVLPMTWDYAETNPLAGAGGDIAGTVDSVSEVLDKIQNRSVGTAVKRDAVTTNIVECSVIFTDPPYYDNISYADLSGFFYIWLRRSLQTVYPTLFSTMLAPKAQELVATPYRFGGNKDQARQFFEEGLGKAFTQMRAAQHLSYPLAVYYAFKQAEAEEDDANGASTSGAASTGWETMLGGLIKAGFTITGTWPMRTELTTRNVGRGTNALASSIVLICRPRPESVALATRREFIAALRRELPDALKKLQHGNAAPVDLAQASIGPGMAVFSRYAKVLEADGLPMSVRTALRIINQELDAYLPAQEGEMDPETRFCVAWFEQYGLRAAKFGEADVLVRAKNTSVEGLRRAGVLHAAGGEVRLLARAEMDPAWDPRTDRRVTDWECAQHLIRALSQDGEDGAARLAQRMGGEKTQIAHDLAYRLFAICERTKWADEALAYNALVASWPAIQEKAVRIALGAEQQERLL